jgi:PEGA domain
MRVLRISLFLIVAAVAITSFENQAFAEKQVIARPPVVRTTHYYHHYPRFGYYYSPFYRPYYFSPYYYPFGFGLGYGYGYGYGYGPPYGGYYYRGYGEVRTEIKPKEAKVYVDGDYVGEVDDFDGWWQRMQLEPGRHRIVFRAPGYSPYAVTLRVLPGQDYKIKQQLQPGDDTIPDSDMRLPDRDYDRDYDQDHDRDYDQDHDRDYDRDYGSKNRNYRDRDYQYQDRDEQYDRDDNDREYDTDQDRYQSENPGEDRSQSDKHPIMLQIEPTDATIYVDGNYYGTADVNASGEVQVLLPPGVHRIEIVRPGYESYSKEIHVNGKYNTERLVISLKKK